jgi:hypothetical protein
MNRRGLLGTLSFAATLGTIATARAAEPVAALPAPPTGAHIPKLEFVYECDVTIEDPQEFGTTVEGRRRVIPITGGSFRGPNISGQVLSGGADWNLSRNDGVSSVEAAYYLRTDDGVTIRIVNKGLRYGAPQPADSASGELFFMYTEPVFEAPAGKYEWLNHAMYVATLGARREVKKAVLIRVFRLV